MSIELFGIGKIAYYTWRAKLVAYAIFGWFYKPQDDLTGSWISYFVKDGKLHQEQVELVQLGKYIWGYIKYADKDIVYKFSGNIKVRIISATYEPASGEKPRDRGCFNLMGNDRSNLETLSGVYSWMIDDFQRPHSDSYVWLKSGIRDLESRVIEKTSAIAGSGAFAEKDFFIKEIIQYFEGDKSAIQTEYSLTFDGVHIEPTGVLRNLNHSCEPNCSFDGRWLHANRTINKGEELTIDYVAIEGMLTSGFNCKCKKPNCRKRVE